MAELVSKVYVKFALLAYLEGYRVLNVFFVRVDEESMATYGGDGQ